MIDYEAFLLRIWNLDEKHLRILIESAATGERFGFSSLTELTEWLEENTPVQPAYIEEQRR